MGKKQTMNIADIAARLNLPQDSTVAGVGTVQVFTARKRGGRLRRVRRVYYSPIDNTLVLIRK